MDKWNAVAFWHPDTQEVPLPAKTKAEWGAINRQKNINLDPRNYDRAVVPGIGTDAQITDSQTNLTNAGWYRMEVIAWPQQPPNPLDPTADPTLTAPSGIVVAGSVASVCEIQQPNEDNPDTHAICYDTWIIDDALVAATLRQQAIDEVQAAYQQTINSGIELNSTTGPVRVTLSDSNREQMQDSWLRGGSGTRFLPLQRTDGSREGFTFNTSSSISRNNYRAMTSLWLTAESQRDSALDQVDADFPESPEPPTPVI